MTKKVRKIGKGERKIFKKFYFPEWNRTVEAENLEEATKKIKDNK